MRATCFLVVAIAFFNYCSAGMKYDDIDHLAGKVVRWATLSFQEPLPTITIRTAASQTLRRSVSVICIVVKARKLVISDIVSISSRIASVFGYHAAKTVSCTPAFAPITCI
jgi:hypothetical protein